ncbi:hypothetical protein [Mycobacterium avium]|uniref:hypothetical protein n=1 Tax=Mycobacterium avium TaxID=1764 RepID=UPI001F290C70|nr:hypothetical protein [Mycobacterium avium]
MRVSGWAVLAVCTRSFRERRSEVHATDMHGRRLTASGNHIIRFFQRCGQNRLCRSSFPISHGCPVLGLLTVNEQLEIVLQSTKFPGRPLNRVPGVVITVGVGVPQVRDRLVRSDLGGAGFPLKGLH